MHPGPNDYPTITPPPSSPRAPTRAPQPEPQPEPSPEPSPLTHEQWSVELTPNDDDVRSDDPSHDCELVHATSC